MTTNSESAQRESVKAYDPEKGNPKALLPIVIFLVLYLGLGIIFEYILGIEMGFYSIPIVVVFLVALCVACVQNKSVSLDEKIGIMGRGMGERIIVTMVLIFLTAGVFVGTVGRSSADSCAYFLLSVIPPQYAIAVLFVVACFVSIAMGTSVGTITLITPIAVSVSAASGFSMPLCIAAVMSGAMFGDNLSFISDTTIAACQGQGCNMQDKFKENFKIALPAAIVALIVFLVISLGADINDQITGEYDLIQVIPYVVVLIMGICGINVFVVLIVGIVLGSVIMLATGASAPMDLITNMGSGCSGMWETAMVALIVGALGALIREYGGFVAMLAWFKKIFRGRKAGQLGMGLLVGCMDIATANNTVAIVMSNPIAADMAELYGVSRRKTASILDTFSCVFQGILPYGAQMLVAIGAAATLGYSVSAFQIMPFLFYPFFLLISCLVFIFIVPAGKGEEQRVEAEAAERAAQRETSGIEK